MKMLAKITSLRFVCHRKRKCTSFLGHYSKVSTSFERATCGAKSVQMAEEPFQLEFLFQRNKYDRDKESC